MSVVGRGVRNAFRNSVRTSAIVAILGLSLGLSLAMLVAHKAVQQKIDDVKASVGNTITIQPAGFNSFSSANNSLTTSELAPVKSIAHITSLTETLSDGLQTTGTTHNPRGADSFSKGGGDSTGGTTSLKSPVKLQNNGNGTVSGGGLFISGGGSGNFQLPSNFSPPIPIIGTNNPTQLDSLSGASASITSGTEIDGSKDTNQAMVSTDMASKNNLKIGSTFTAYGKTLTVAAIYDSGTQSGNDTIIVSLPALQRLSGQGDNVTNASATVDSLDNLSSATNAVKSALGSNADVTNAQDEADNTVEPLKNIQKVSLYSLVGAAIVGAVIIFMTMLMIVRERRREIGVLKAIGAPNLKVVWQFMSEAVTFTLLAAVIGIVIGVAAANPITNTLVNNNTNNSQGTPPGAVTRSIGAGQSVRANFVGPGRGFSRVGNTLTNIHAAVGWSIVLYGLAAAVGIAIVGSGAASWLITRIRPAEVMRLE